MKATSPSHATEPCKELYDYDCYYPYFIFCTLLQTWTTVLKRQNNTKNKPIPVCGKLRQNKTTSIFGYAVPIYSQTFR